MSRLARIASALAFGVLAVLALPAPASAHAYLVAAAPADGAVLDRGPEILTLSFTERVELTSARITIVDGDGRHWTVTSLALRAPDDGAPQAAIAADTEEPINLVAGLPALPPNTYHVSWQTLSSDDLHITSGTLVFGVQREVTAAARPSGPAGPAPREAAVRGIGLLGLATLLGGAGLALVQAAAGRTPSGRPDGVRPDPRLRRRLLRVAGYGGAVALLATPVQLLIQLSAAGSSGRALLAAQLVSGRWLLRELGLAALLAAVLWARRGLRAGQIGPAIALGAGGAVATSAATALLGHPLGSPTTTVLVGAVHVLAAGGWAGGVLASALALLPVLRTGPDRAAQVRAVLHAFAVLALSCLTALAVTGLLLTGAQVATVDALLTTPYGLLLMAKVAAVGAAGLLGLRMARRVRRGAELPRRGLAVEAILLTGVLILAGSLAAAGPARGPRFPVAGPVETVPEVSGQAADLIDTVAVRPNRPGRNVVSITVSDTRRPAPAPVTGVSVMLTGPDGVGKIHPVTRTGDGWVVTVDDIRSPGHWRVAVTVLREGLPPVTDAHPWAVPAADAGRASVLVSATPLRPAVDVLAGLLVVAAACAALLAGRRWLRGRGGPPPDSPEVIEPPQAAEAVQPIGSPADPVRSG